MLGERSWRAARLAALLFVACGGTAGLLAQPSAAYALFSGCRNDPLVWLSDGTKLRITVQIDAQLAQVQDVYYVVHGPVGTTLDKVHYPGPKGMPERLDYLADAADGVYMAEVTVQTTGDQVDVELSMKAGQASTLADGRSGQRLSVSLTP